MAESELVAHFLNVSRIAQPPPSPKRVLVAEDNSVNQKVAVAMLEKIGYQTDVVANGGDAVEAVSRTDYAAVLMDCQMPAMDGFDATREIRNREQGRGRIPIIAMTAAAMQGDKEKCLAAGMDDFISKPVMLDELDEVLRRWVGTADYTAPIDPARIEQLSELSGEGGRNGFLVLAEIFVADGRARLTGIQDAMRRGDSEAVEAEAHALLGSSANIGAMNLSGLCRQLEQLASSGTLVGGEDLLKLLEAEYARVDQVLKEQLEG